MCPHPWETRTCCRSSRSEAVRKPCANLCTRRSGVLTTSPLSRPPLAIAGVVKGKSGGPGREHTHTQGLHNEVAQQIMYVYMYVCMYVCKLMHVHMQIRLYTCAHTQGLHDEVAQQIHPRPSALPRMGVARRFVPARCLQMGRWGRRELRLSGLNCNSVMYVLTCR